MSGSIALIRIRFPRDVVERLDQLAERLRATTRRAVPRAVVIRVLVQRYMTTAGEGQDLAEVLGADPVKRGRQCGSRSARRRGATNHSGTVGSIRGEGR